MKKILKKTLKKLSALCMAAIMVAGMSTTAFAASGNTVYLIGVEGYLDDAVSVSNVIGTAEKSYSDYSPTYICNYPAEVKLHSGLADFFVEKIEFVNGRSETKETLPVDGKISFCDNSIQGDRIVDYNDFPKYNVRHGSLVLEGSTVTLTENGIYRVYGIIGLPRDYISMYIIVDDKASPAEPIPAEPITAKEETYTAMPTSSKVEIRDQHSTTPGIAFDAYNIEGNNYFKLRDLAYTLYGSEKQFEVEWNSGDNAIMLTSNAEYTTVGGEREGKGTVSKSAMTTSSKILLDGKEITPTGYNIGGNNYFKLRDIGQLFDFGVTWDATTNRIIIDTSTGYTPE